MRESIADKPMRRIIRCSWRCKHCGGVFGAENVAFYGVALPNLARPTWFFASMTLLDHLRDCQSTDFSESLRAAYGADFLNHHRIHEWYNVHATVERALIAEENLD